MITKCAEAGKGTYYFVNDLAEGLSECVIQALSASMEPAYKVDSIKLDLNAICLKELVPLSDFSWVLRNGSYLSYAGIF